MSTETRQEIMNTKKVLVTFFNAKSFREDEGDRSSKCRQSFQLTWDNLKGTNSSAGSYSLKQVSGGILR